MGSDISRIPPADSTGFQTARRFTYQTEFAFPYCLVCALGGPVEMVILEHHEDVVIRRSGNWHFCQVKTRDAGLPPWRLSDLLDASGAFQSLWRTHCSLAHLPDVRLAACLEGAVSSSDKLIQKLKSDAPHEDSELVSHIADRLDSSDAAVRAFLARFDLLDGLPTRSHIRAVNLDMLGKSLRRLNREQIEALYDDFLGKIREAMDGTLGDSDWEIAIMNPDALEPMRRDLARRKRLVCSDFAPLIGALRTEAPGFLLQVVSGESARASALRSKLQDGGAGPVLADQAIQLRAKAAVVEFQYLSASVGRTGPDLFQDVRARLQLRHTSLREQHREHSTPAIPLWADLISHLSSEAAQLDPRSVFQQDAYLLLGEVCSMADECILDFGRTPGAA